MLYTGIPFISKTYDLKPGRSSQEPLDDKLVCLLILYKSLGSFIVGSKLNAKQKKNLIGQFMFQASCKHKSKILLLFCFIKICIKVLKTYIWVEAW